MTTLWVGDNRSAVDASIARKGDGLKRYISRHGIKPDEIAYIGDGKSDLDVARLGIGMLYVPANSAPLVKEAAKNLGGVASEKNAYNAFDELYAKAMENGIRHVFSDRDGVLTLGKDMSYGPVFSKLMRFCGIGPYPDILVLTGSGAGEQARFLWDFGLNKYNLERSSSVKKNPHRLLIENGMEAIDVMSVTGDPNDMRIASYAEQSDAPGETAIADFRRSLMERMKRTVLPAFDFEFTSDYENQDSRVYCPKKKWMVTVNVPRSKNGRNFRQKLEADDYRRRVIDSMMETGKSLGVTLNLE